LGAWYGLHAPYEFYNFSAAAVCSTGTDKGQIMASRSRRPSPKNRASRQNNARNEGRLPRNASPITVTITHIGGRGDGIGTASYTHNYREANHDVFVPASLPGETVTVQPLSISKQGIKARIIELHTTSPARQTPQCNAFPACGGCSFQHWLPSEIDIWKRQLISAHLERAQVSSKSIRPTIVSPPYSRRRASFHIKRLADKAVIGFRERMGLHIVDPDGCVVLDHRLYALKSALGAFATAHFPSGATVDAQVNLLASSNSPGGTGMCLYLQNSGAQPLWTPALQAALTEWAAANDLARLSIDDYGSPLTLFSPILPQVDFGITPVTPPPGAFLQATQSGEQALKNAVAEILEGHRMIADLFAGCGTLSLPLIAQLTGLLAVESDAAALSALKMAVDAAGQGGRLTALQRNLFDAPLLPVEFDKITGVILDPPRSGASAQCQQLAKSAIATIAMVSCNPASFARDAAFLTDAGFSLDWVQPVDQFSYSNHLELVGAFSR